MPLANGIRRIYVDHLGHQLCDGRTNPKEPFLDITRTGARLTANGSADYFTGTVRIAPIGNAHDSARAQSALVTFDPGARTAWHTHPLGQTLIITAGAGLVQRWGGPDEVVYQSDVVWFPPGEKHWHGAAPQTMMSHIAMHEVLNGKAVDWLEQVTDTQYKGA